MIQDQIRELARRVADTLYSRTGDKSSVELMADEYVDVINEILKTHHIVNNEKVIALYSEAKKNFLDLTGDPFRQAPHWSEMLQLEELFGRVTFKDLLQ